MSEDDVLRNDLTTYRRSGEPELCEALSRRDPLALAEACSRTLPVAYAVGRRYLPSTEIDALLHTVYTHLWDEPPTDMPLERWIRSRCSELAVAELRSTGRAPATPSVRTIVPDLAEPSLPYVDTTERTLAALDESARSALLRAHDQGVPSSEQDDPDAPRSLSRALRSLAEPDGDQDDSDATDGRLADWVLGLLPPDEADEIERGIAGDADRTARTQALRRGRRRIEGLPPTPDLGPRLIAAVLSGSSATRVGPQDETPSDGTGADETPPPPTALTAPRTPSAAVPPPEAAAAGGTADDELLDTAWQPPDTGDDDGPAFDDTPPGGLPVAESALDATPGTHERGLRLSDLFDEDDDDTVAVASDARTEEDGAHDPPTGDEGDRQEPDHDPFAELRQPDGDDEIARDHDPDGEGGADDAWAQDDAWGHDGTGHDDPRFDEDDDGDGGRPSTAKRFLQFIGLLLLLGAAVGIGLLIGQFGVETLQR